MPVGTPFHPRLFEYSESLSFRDWAGWYAATSYETRHEHEYHAIRHACALIDVSPLFKYIVSGPDALRLVDRVVTRDVRRLAVGQVWYTPWCDEHGLVLDDGTVARIGPEKIRWTAAEPNLRWLRENATGLDVSIEDATERLAALAVQGPTSFALVDEVSRGAVRGLRYFRTTSAEIGGVPVDISRTGYTGDLGYELWVPAEGALAVWDAIAEAAPRYGARPAGLLALDVARIEAGLLLIDVDFTSSRKAQIPAQAYTPFEMGLGRLVDFDKGPFVGARALAHAAARPARRIVTIEVAWDGLEALYARFGLTPVLPATASRAATPVYRGRRQIGKATSTTWSPVLKRLIALATVETASAAPGTRVEMEVTIEGERLRAPAVVRGLPLFNPPRKTARF